MRQPVREDPEAGASAIELLCGLLILGLIGGMMVSLMVAVARRTAALNRADELDRRSERVFAVISDAVRAQREAAMLPLWTIFAESDELDRIGWPASIPRRGPHAPASRSPVLAFAKLSAELQLRVLSNSVLSNGVLSNGVLSNGQVSDSAGGRGSIDAVPLCMQLLFGGSSPKATHSGHFLGIAADRIIPLQGTVRTQRLSSSRCRGVTAVGDFREDSNPWPFQRLDGSSIGAPSAPWPRGVGPLLSSDLIAVRPVLDAFALYLDRHDTVRRASLLTVENQPVISEVRALQVTVSSLPEISEYRLGVALHFQGSGRSERTEQWILPVAKLGEHLIGII